ncbi:MAG TPA: NAD+ synthase [Stellaceae bacterium]
MTDQLTMVLAQLDPTVGDIEGNLAKLRHARAEAAAMGADLIVATELYVAGYTPEDLVLKPAFVAACEAAVARLARDMGPGPAVILGTPWRQDGKLYNAAALLDDGRIAALRFKHELPNYGVFDEKRVFAAGPAPGPVVVKGVRIGLMICEDMWTPDATEALGESGAELLLVINGSPYERDKRDERVQLAVMRVTESGLPLAYVNQICGQDELVFDGASFVLDADCDLKVQAPDWRETLIETAWRRGPDGAWQPEKGMLVPPTDELAAIYHAMVLGLGDYVRKNRFPGVVLGLSGGIDSAICAAIAVDALGADKVHCVMMPSRYTSRDSLDDAAEAARLLDVDLRTIDIEPAIAAFGGMLAPSFAGRAPDITEENLQSRARGITLMALSNKFGWMVLSTGNKSEMSVGYATLYGDMCGGFAVLKDVYKMTVFALSRWRNGHHPDGLLGPDGRVMPDRIITKPPTAELKDNQTDQDTLPPYDRLDDILECLIEREMPVGEIVARGHDEATVRRVWRMLDRAEYKRRQAPPGVKITRRAFGRDRRYPITNGFTDANSLSAAEPSETPRAPTPAAT